MTLDELVALLKSVLLTPEVIGVTIVIAIYVSIVNYIVRYRKKAPQPKQKRVKPPAAAKPAGGRNQEELADEDEIGG